VTKVKKIFCCDGGRHSHIRHHILVYREAFQHTLQGGSLARLLTAITRSAAGYLAAARDTSQNIGRCLENFMQLASTWLLASLAGTMAACRARDEFSPRGRILWMPW
jgi:hypothetical protein